MDKMWNSKTIMKCRLLTKFIVTVATSTEATQKKEKKTKKNEIDMSDESPPTETDVKTTTDDVDMEEQE